MDLSSQELNQLYKEANDAKQFSYSPYSKFRVGAALLGNDGQVFIGTNVENASFGNYNFLSKVGRFVLKEVHLFLQSAGDVEHSRQ